MDAKKINAASAMLKVMEEWGVKTIYGLPGGSINSTIEALYNNQSNIQYVQIRHEEVGALAASAFSKLTNEIGVCFGSAGPGAVHLLNGLYDAKHDKTPMLAIIGQVGSKLMNANYFQELNEDPIFRDVAVYNRVCMDPNMLPYMVDDAIRLAYEYNGVACITVPVDFGTVEIDDVFKATAQSFSKTLPLPNDQDVERAIELLKAAKKPLLFFGQGAKGAREELIAVAHQYAMPMVSTVLGRNIVGDDEPYYLKASGRLGTKPAVEAIQEADLILFVGSDFPFAKVLFKPEQKFIQIDVKPSVIGKRHFVDVGINADAKQTLKLIANGLEKPKEESDYLKACLKNMENWNQYVASFLEIKDGPIWPEAIMQKVNELAKDDAILVGDVGNVTIYCAKLFNFKPTHQWTTSAIYATMGYGVPGGIGAKIAYPDKQVFTISGDGGFAMANQDIITQVKYNLPIINIVMTNKALGFIVGEQIGEQHVFGVDLADADYGAMSTAMGANGFTVKTYAELEEVFNKEEVKNPTKPVVIDIKITEELPFPTHQIKLDKDRFSQEEIDEFKKTYHVKDMPTLKELMNK